MRKIASAKRYLMWDSMSIVDYFVLYQNSTAVPFFKI
jgi:hypothetical protein